MGSFKKSEVRRVGAGGSENPHQPRQPKSNSTADDLAHWYSELPYGTPLSSAQKWRDLLKICHGNADEVKTLVAEARKNKHLVVNEKWPRFTLQSVIAYATYYRPEKETGEEVVKINEFAKAELDKALKAEPLDAKRISHLVRMLNVRRGDLRRIYADAEYNVLLTTTSDASWRTDSGNSAALPG